MNIQPSLLTFDRLLQGRLFRIPQYQRAYSWGSKEREHLFADIRKIDQHGDGDRHHFMSTVVCLKRERESVGATEFETFDVVDGQQRLITLIIILRALGDALGEGDGDERIEATNLTSLLVKRDKRLILLQTNHDKRGILRNYLEGKPTRDVCSVHTLAERNLVDAIAECTRFVEGWSTGPLSLLGKVKNRLDFVFFVVEDEGSVYTIFEVLNSRGLEVDSLDKCKSVLMGIAFDNLPSEVRTWHIEALHSRWTAIYETIGVRKVPGHEILRFSATFKQPHLANRITSSANAIEFFRDYCEREPTAVVEVSSEFLSIAEQLKDLYGNRRLEAVTDILHARLLAVAIMMTESLSDQERTDVLDLWEKVTFRIFGLLRKDARVGVGSYTRLAYRIYKQEVKGKAPISQEIAAIGEGFPIDDAIKELHGADCYNGWENDLRYFLYRYEEDLAKEAGREISTEVWTQIWDVSSHTTVEHIHPQTQTPNRYWKGKLGRGPRQVDKHVHRLGNLILLPPDLNSEAGAQPFSKKKEIYKRSDLLMVREITEQKDWDRRTIARREDRLLEWAKRTWG